MAATIKCLPGEVQEKLRSGVSVPSLQQCVEELVCNSLDAGATCVGVRVDTDSLKVQVIDNGCGMSCEDMERVGNRYHTSKCSSMEDMEELRWYGFRGEALASISALATLLEITSRTRSSAKTHVKVFKNGRGLDVFEAEVSRPSAGTTVIISNFFHNMPVRRKRLDAVLEAERIRHRVEAVSLMHPSVSFTLRNDSTGAMMVQLSKAKNTHHRFAQIHGMERAQKLSEICHVHGPFEVTGHICKEGHYNNSLQFLYVNSRLLLKTRIHKLLNILLRRLSGTNQRNDSPDGQSAIRSPKHKRSQEPHGVYIIDIKCQYSEYDICLEPAKTLIEFKDWDGALFCVEEAVKGFLSRENLVAVLSKDDFDCASPVVNFASRESYGALALDHSIGTKLASESVHRSRRDNVTHDESGPMECAGEGNEFVADSEKTQNEDLKDGTYNDVTQQDHASDKNINGKLVIGKAPNMCVSTSPEIENVLLLNDTELQFNNTTSSNSETAPDSVSPQIQPHLNCSDQLLPQRQETEKLSISNRKISVCDPFIHQSLRSSLHINKSVFHHKHPAQIHPASKSKISLVAGQRRHSDFAPVIPTKIPRVGSKQMLSLRSECGSLDKFRRMFGKCKESRLSSPESHLQDCDELPPVDSLIGNHQNTSVFLKDQQDGQDDAGTENHLHSPATPSHLTRLKTASVQNKGGKSLAAKLSLLKHQEPVSSSMVTDCSATSSLNSCTQDSNNNEEDPCDAPPNPEPASGHHVDETPEESDNWIHHYDTFVGKTVYVNRATGLSKYEATEEEPQARCTTDVTNMAVSVVSETGMEYRCYPFQLELVLPFLPKSKTDRVMSSLLGGTGSAQTVQTVDNDDGENSNSLSSMYSKWNNPVFVRPPTVGVDISSAQADGLAVKIHNILFPYRFSKAMMQSMKVISQVDRKFLACLISTREEESTAQTELEGNLLVLVDQHAAHERVRLENLVTDSFEGGPDASGQRHLRSSNIVPPLEISVTEGELRLLRSCQAQFQSLGLELTFSEAADPHVFVKKVPLCFGERESNELKRGRPSVIKPIVEEYLREQIELLRSAGRVRGTLPLTVLKVLASLACHGAIKFNHSLNRDECVGLVTSLSSCQLPFQCAHGRPSMIPLVDILHLDNDQKESQKPNLQKLRKMHRAWELYGKR